MRSQLSLLAVLLHEIALVHGLTRHNELPCIITVMPSWA